MGMESFMSKGLMRRLALVGALSVIGAVIAQSAELPTMRAAPAKRAQTCHVGGMEGVLTAGGLCVKISGSITAGVDVGNLKSSTSK
jgi:hypothetical protein